MNLRIHVHQKKDKRLAVMLRDLYNSALRLSPKIWIIYKSRNITGYLFSFFFHIKNAARDPPAADTYMYIIGSRPLYRIIFVLRDTAAKNMIIVLYYMKSNENEMLR